MESRLDTWCEVTPTQPDVFDLTCNFSWKVNETKHDVCVHRYAFNDTNSREPGLVICCRCLSGANFRCSDGNGKSFASTISEKFVYRMESITEGRYVCDVIPQEPGNQMPCVWKGPATSMTTSTTTLFTSTGNATVLPEEADVSEGLTAGAIAGIVILLLLVVCAVVVILVFWRKIKNSFANTASRFREHKHTASDLDSRDPAEDSTKEAESAVVRDGLLQYMHVDLSVFERGEPRII